MRRSIVSPLGSTVEFGEITPGAAYRALRSKSDASAAEWALLDNNSIAAAAGIAYSKLTLTGSVAVGDLASSTKNANVLVAANLGSNAATYDTGALTNYDFYELLMFISKVNGGTTISSLAFNFNNDASATHNYSFTLDGGAATTATAQTAAKCLSSGAWNFGLLRVIYGGTHRSDVDTRPAFFATAGYGDDSNGAHSLAAYGHSYTTLTSPINRIKVTADQSMDTTTRIVVRGISL